MAKKKKKNNTVVVPKADMKPITKMASAGLAANKSEGKIEPEINNNSDECRLMRMGDERLMREGEKGTELYARIVQMPKNKRYVVVCPYLDGFLPGRMVVPKRGRERKVFVQTDDGLKEKTIEGKFSKRGAKFWVRPVGEDKGLYEFVPQLGRNK